MIRNTPQRKNRLTWSSYLRCPANVDLLRVINDNNNYLACLIINHETHYLTLPDTAPGVNALVDQMEASTGLFSISE